MRRRQTLATVHDEDVWLPMVLLLSIGVFYIGLLHLYATPLKVEKLTTVRYMLAMPVDNELPRRFAERLIFGISPKHLYDTGG